MMSKKVSIEEPKANYYKLYLRSGKKPRKKIVHV